MKKRYIIPFVLVFVLMSVAMASADGYGYGCYQQQYCYPNCCAPYPYYPPQPVVRECASFVSDVTIADGSYIAPALLRRGATEPPTICDWVINSLETRFQPRHNAPQLTDKLVASSRLHAAYQ